MLTGFDKTQTDYSVYLVTDTGLVPEGKTLEQQVAGAIEGGATLVQLREKTAETGDFVSIAKAIHALTKAANIPLLINDRLDVALAIDCEGVHVGQTDMPVVEARRLLGPDKIIGLSITTNDEYLAALKQDELGAHIDYFGVGAVYGTFTKKLRAAPQGLSGMRKLMRQIADTDSQLPKHKQHQFVTIGGIKQGNCAAVRYMCGGDGVAVVSCLIAAEDPQKATEWLSCEWHKRISEPRVTLSNSNLKESVDKVISAVPGVFVHHVTNNVVKNVSANITIAIGASPAMSETRAEFDEFAAIPRSSLLLNMGTATTDGVETFLAAGQAYNRLRRPVVFDPVGGGASRARKEAVVTLLKGVLISVIKGNDGEIFSAANVAGSTMRGVDSVDKSSLEARKQAAIALADSANCVVVMTGETDVVAAPDGRTVVLSNGNELLAEITGSGCMLGSVITACCGASEDTFTATVAAVLLYTVASEYAAKKADGPGTFIPRLMDEIWRLRKCGLSGEELKVDFD